MKGDDRMDKRKRFGFIAMLACLVLVAASVIIAMFVEPEIPIIDEAHEELPITDEVYESDDENGNETIRRITSPFRINQNMPIFRFYVVYFDDGDRALRIKNQSREVVQEISELTQSHVYNNMIDSEPEIQFADWNFDGYTDIDIWRHWMDDEGEWRTRRYFWLWDTETSQFVVNEQLMELSQTGWVGQDRDLQQIRVRSLLYIGSKYFVHNYYAYEDGSYVYAGSQLRHYEVAGDIRTLTIIDTPEIDRHQEWTIEELGEIIVSAGTFWEEWWGYPVGRFSIEHISFENQDEIPEHLGRSIYLQLLPTSGFENLNDIREYLLQFYTAAWVDAELSREFAPFVEYDYILYINSARAGIVRPRWDDATHVLMEQGGGNAVVDTTVVYGAWHMPYGGSPAGEATYSITFIDGRIDSIDWYWIGP